MARSTDAQKAERLNAAHSLLARGVGMAEAAVSLSRQFRLSRRQAYRYLQEAQAIGHAVPLVAPSVPITLKMPANVVHNVRAYSVISGLTISEIVTRAITAFLAAVPGMADRRSVGITTKSSLITHSTAGLGSSFSKFTNSWFPTRSGSSASVSG